MIENIDFTPPNEPFALFKAWLALAETHEPNDPNAMALATMGVDGFPTVRIVLMKELDEKGFVFYTNRKSHKGEQIHALANAGLCFHWKSLKRQVRVEGKVELVSDAESDAYFATRPRGSQIGAWASQQSHTLEDRQTLEQRVLAFEKKYDGLVIPRPSHWGGYRVVPHRIEFWQDRLFRLHDRIVYKRNSEIDEWQIDRLYP